MPSDKTLISVRLSGEALAALDTWPGMNRTDKLEGLIMEATLRRPAMLDELAELADAIKDARAELADLRDIRRRLSNLDHRLNEIEQDMARKM